MRFVPVNCIREEMIVAKQLLGRNGEILLNTGSVIHASYIEKIKQLGYNGIYINDDLSKDIVISEIISNDLRLKTVKTMKDAFINIENGKCIPESSIRNINDIVVNIVEDVLSNKDAMINMIDLKVFDDYTFYHSVNVAVLSIVVGVALNLDKKTLNNLGLAALLHDIGKVFIPKHILNKPGKLTDEEFEIIKTHSLQGYQYLRESFKIPSPAYVSILQHHERYDGRGYPGQIRGNQISLLAQIISVTDVYDALTSNRSYRKALNPSEAIEYIMGGGGTLFDPQTANCFVERVAPYPVGTCILLSDGTTGIVMENYSDCSMRPKVKIIRKGNDEVQPYNLDLKNDKSTLGIIITSIAEL